MKFSKNFDLNEFIQSPTALKFNINEQFSPPEDVVENLRLLCLNVLQPLRDAIGIPIEITSGYRCEALNKFINGAKNSEHQFGKAADIRLMVNGQNLSKKIFDKIIELKLPFRQLIDEKNYTWVHVSYDIKDIKKQILHL